MGACARCASCLHAGHGQGRCMQVCKLSLQFQVRMQSTSVCKGPAAVCRWKGTGSQIPVLPHLLPLQHFAPHLQKLLQKWVQCRRPGHHVPSRDSDATAGPGVHEVQWEAGKGHPGCPAWEGVLSARAGFLYFDDNFPCSWLSGSWLAAPPPQSCSEDLTPQLFSEENTRLPSYVFPFPVFVFASKSPHHPVW